MPDYELIEPRSAGALAFTLRVRATGRLYRVAPARDPRQPRLWCVMVYRCSEGGLGDPGEPPWLGAGGMSREDLPATMAAIRADVGAWLAGAHCGELRRWVLDGADEPLAAGG